jgi:hypothetical protein
MKCTVAFEMKDMNASTHKKIFGIDKEDNNEMPPEEPRTGIGGSRLIPIALGYNEYVGAWVVLYCNHIRTVAS